jgi:hypothetical protein
MRRPQLQTQMRRSQNHSHYVPVGGASKAVILSATRWNCRKLRIHMLVVQHASSGLTIPR